MIKKILKVLLYVLIMIIWFPLFDKIKLNLVGYEYYVDYANLIKVLLLFIITMILFRKTKLSIYHYILSIIFSVILMVGGSIQLHQTIERLLVSDIYLIWEILMLVEYSLLFIVLFKSTKHLLSFVLEDNKKIPNVINKCLYFYKKHPIIISFILIFLSWLVYIIAYYPGIIYGDGKNQLLQYLNLPTEYLKYANLRNPNFLMTTHHPLLHTYLIGWCYSLGKLLLNDNFGFFIYSFLQMISLIILLSYMIKMAFKYNVKPMFIIMLLLSYMILPMYAYYSITIGKDTFYFIFYALTILFLFDYVSNINRYELTKKNLIALFFILLLTCLFRHNGVYVLIAFIPLMILSKKDNRKRIFVILVSVIICLFSFNKVLIPLIGISDGSIKEMLSIPFQQTARYNQINYDFVSEEERNIIDKVLDYESIVNSYSPVLSDPVKKYYKKDATFKDLKNYYYVWLYQGLKNPVIYIDATINNTYGFYYPFVSKWYVYYNQFDFSEYDIDYHYNKLEQLRDNLYKNSNFFHKDNILGLTSNVGFSFWWLLLLTAYILEKKRFRYLITLIPLFITFIFCILGPANIHFRYALPNIFILPVLTLLIIYKIKNYQN